jgi:hypothetical protein
MFASNPVLNEWQRRLQPLLAAAEAARDADPYRRPTKPVVLVVGAPRSGTTLTTQWLAASGAFAYPTNLLSRFAAAPFFGAMLQRLITDPALDFAGELTGAGIASRPWQSIFGKTSGLLEPHEFSFFWRRFFPMDQARPLSDAELSTVDHRGCAAALADLESVFERPLAAKGIILQYLIDVFVASHPTAIVLRVERDPVATVASLLAARRAVRGSESAWFSVQPPGTKWLETEEPVVQVAGQVRFTSRALDAQLARVPVSRVVQLSYGSFCEDVMGTWEALAAACREVGYDLPAEPQGPRAFPASERSLDESLTQQVRTAIARVDTVADSVLPERFGGHLTEASEA